MNALIKKANSNKFGLTKDKRRATLNVKIFVKRKPMKQFDKITAKLKATQISAGVLLVVAFAGCAAPGPNAKTGAVAGGALGAIVGGVIGHQSGRALEGAAIGAGAGALGGGALGSAQDDRERQEFYRQAE